MNGTMIVMPKDYFWHLLKDGHYMYSKAATFIMFSFKLSSGVLSVRETLHKVTLHEEWSSVIAFFFLLNSIHHKHSCVQCVGLTHKQHSKSIGQFPFYRQYWDSGLCLPHWSPDFPQPIRESH